MRVLHVSTSDIDGGAALAAYRLHRAMLKRDQDCSRMLVRTKSSRDPSVTAVLHTKTLSDRVARRITRWRIRRDRVRHAGALAKVEAFSDARDSWGNRAGAQASNFDVVQLHSVSKFLNFQRFFGEIPAAIPLVWRLPDMNPFTGGCHYDGGCGRFTDACGRCPMLESQQEDDLSRMTWRLKKQAFDQLGDERLHIVALNQWMADQVRRSSLFSRFACTVIPNGVDLEEFTPLPPSAARQALGIPSDRKIIAFVADHATNLRKGFHLLLDALQILSKRQDLFLLVVGRADQLPPIDVPSLQVGQVQSVTFLRQIYSAAHMFVIPSLEDNQPNTVLEAMACGTPVVGFKAGGIPEMVEHGKAGLLAPRGNVQELARSIEYLLDHEDARAAMALHARRRIEQVYSRDAQVEKYFQLYHRVLEKPAAIANRPPVPAPAAFSGQTPLDGCATPTTFRLPSP